MAHTNLLAHKLCMISCSQGRRFLHFPPIIRNLSQINKFPPALKLAKNTRNSRKILPMEKLQFSLFRSYECSKHAATSFDTVIRNRTLYRKARKIDRNPFLKAFLCRPRVKVTTTTDVPAKKSQKALSFTYSRAVSVV